MKQIDELFEKLDNMEQLGFKQEILQKYFPEGYHYADISWEDNEYSVRFFVSDGYSRALNYTSSELPPTMKSKQLVSSQEDINKSNLAFDKTIRTGKPTKVKINQRAKGGQEIEFLAFNTITSFENGKPKTLFGYQVGLIETE